MNNRTYNVDAFGLPASLVVAVAKLGNSKLPLFYTRHAKLEAVQDRYGVLPAGSYPETFQWSGNWQLVEAESDQSGRLVKFVVRRVVDARRSLVLVVLVDGTVKTLWTNLNSDQHATLVSEKFSRP